MRAHRGLDNAFTRAIKLLHATAHQIPSVPPICSTVVPSGLLAVIAYGSGAEPSRKISNGRLPPRRHRLPKKAFGQSALIGRATLSSPLPVSLVQMAGIIHNLNDRVARSSFGRYFLLEGSGHPKERRGARFTTELRGGLTTFSSMVHLS